MSKFLVLILNFVLCLGIISCSGKGAKKVETSFSITGFTGGGIYTGGVMVWGMGPGDSLMATALIDETDSQSIELTKGTWEFYSVGWFGASPMDGTMKCGSTVTIVEGEAAVVSLTMNAANCNDDSLSPGGHMAANEFLPLKLIICDDITGKTAGQNCDGGNKGSAKSFLLKFNEISAAGISDGLVSICIDEAGASSVTNTTFKIPVGDGLGSINPLNFEIETFSQLSCGGSSSLFEFPDGLLNLDIGASSHVYVSGSYSEIFLEAPVEAPSFAGYTVDAPAYTEGVSISLNMPIFISGEATSYSVSPALPSGLVFDTTNGYVSGTPSTFQSLVTYTVTGTNSAGSDTTDIDITILEQVPTISTYSSGTVSTIVGVAPSGNIPTVTGGTASSFTIAPALPSGLSINGTTGVISGTPIGASANATYTVTATNSGGSSTYDVDYEVLAPALVTISDGATYDYGTQAVGSQTSYSFTVTNSGEVTATGFSEVGLATPFQFLGGSFPGTGGDCAGSLAASANCSIVVAYSPVGTGAHSDTIDINYNDGASAQSATRGVQGTGANPASLSVSPGGPFDYGSVTVGGTSLQTFTVTNSGGFQATSITETGLAPPYSFSGGSFPGVGGDCTTTIAASGSCNIEVEYAPVGTGLSSDDIDLSYDDGASVINVTSGVQGTGIAPASLSIVDISTNDFAVNYAYPVSLTSDLGTWNANTNTTTLADGTGTLGDYYRVDTAGTQDLGSGSQNFAVNDIVLYTGSIWIKGPPPKVITFNVNNGGASNATGVNETTLAPPFNFTGGSFPGASGSCTTTMAPGACTIEVEFAPTTVAEFSGTITLNYNDGAAVQNATKTLLGKGGSLVSIADADDSKCVAFNNGQVKCWGGNGFGQLGQGNTADLGDAGAEMGASLPFVDLGTGVKAVEIVGGSSFFCARLSTGQVKCWGKNNSGQLGYENTNHIGDGASEMGAFLNNVDLGTGRTAKMLAAGATHVCAILDNDNLKCWGKNTDGQLGQGDTNSVGHAATTMGDNLSAIDLGSAVTAKFVETGDDHTCVVTDTNNLKCFGSGLHGRLGYENTASKGISVGTIGDSLATVSLGSGLYAYEVTAGERNTCVHFTSSNDVKCWGNNVDGQLGQENTTSAGDAGTSMGDNLATINMGTSRYAVQVAHNHVARSVCVLLDDETVKCWGEGTYGVLGSSTTGSVGNTGSSMGDILAVLDFGTGRTPKRLSDKGTCALLDNGELKCWGKNDVGQLGLGDTNDRGDTGSEMGDNLPYVDLR